MKQRFVWLFVAIVLGAGMCLGQTATKDSAQNPGFPRVVARLNLFNRTKAIGPQTIYIPTKSGVFRASGAMVCTLGDGGAGNTFWGITVSWTNEVGLNAPTFVSIVDSSRKGSSTQTNSSFIFNATKDIPITVWVTTIGDTSGSAYNAYFVLEQLE